MLDGKPAVIGTFLRMISPYPRTFLLAIDSFPLSVPFHILEIPAGILIADGRDDVTTTTLESVAALFGEVVRTESIPSKWPGRKQITGCLIRPNGNLATVSDKLRAAYAKTRA